MKQKALIIVMLLLMMYHILYIKSNITPLHNY
jgi:hypothetical protein